MYQMQPGTGTHNYEDCTYPTLLFYGQVRHVHIIDYSVLTVMGGAKSIRVDM
jgi:hypothetical protein